MRFTWNQPGIGALIVAVLIATGTARSQQPLPPGIVEEIRNELLKLPHYGVFDFLAFSFEDGTATVAGYVLRPSLKDEAERAVKRPWVSQVINKIEVLPASQADDELRQRLHAGIYGDAFLTKYSTGQRTLWGHRHPASPGLQTFGLWRFPGMEPGGDEPVHIIVKDGRVLLLGVVDSDADRDTAGRLARAVPGSFPLENELAIDRSAAAR
jgi:hypothetical protein